MGQNRPTPTKLLEQSGSDWPLRKRGKSESPEPVPAEIENDIPPELDVVAASEWTRIMDGYANMGVVTSVDRSALVELCRCWSDLCRLRFEVREERETYEDQYGNPRKNPKVSLVDSAFDKWRKLSIEFGLTPSSRTRLNTNGGTPEDDFLSFIESQ